MLKKNQKLDRPLPGLMKDKWARKIMTKCFAFKRYGDENKKSKCTKI